LSDKANVYRLQGLSCMNCAAKFEKNIRDIETVEDVQLNFGASKLTVYGHVTIDQLEEAGPFDHIKVYPDTQQMEEARTPFWKKRENIAALVALMFIIIGYVFTFQMGKTHPFTISAFVLGILIGGYDLFYTGVKNLTKLEFDMKTLMTIAVIGAAIIGEWAEAAVVVFLFAVSEALESYSIDKARHSIRGLMDIAPKRASIKRNDIVQEIDVDDIVVGDIMIIKPGEKIAMDGEVIIGESSVNQAAITGESIPVHKTIGDEVFAGTINEAGSLEVKVTKLAKDTTIAKIIHLVEEAQAEKAPSQKFVDQFAKYYTPAIMVIALLVAVIPPLMFAASWSKWVYLGLAVLVVGCPCALVISTPVSIVTAIGHAARKGVLIKGGIHLEEAGKLNVVAFDKTGTLTVGKPVVTDILTFSNMDEMTILGKAQAIEKYSQHPLASAITHHAEKENAHNYSATDFQSITGKGAKALIKGELYYIGSPQLFKEMMFMADDIEETTKNLQGEGKTVMLFGTEKKVLGLIAVSDQVREDSLSVVKKLHQLGIKNTVMLTGDNFATGKALGESIGLRETYAELLPEDKLQTIRYLQQTKGNTAMVGDGINDAPALAQSTVGIAMGGA